MSEEQTPYGPTVSTQRYEIVGLTKAEAMRALEAIVGCPVVNWSDDAECVITSELRARPIREAGK